MRQNIYALTYSLRSSFDVLCLGYKGNRSCWEAILSIECYLLSSLVLMEG